MAPILWSWQLSPFSAKVRIAAELCGVELDLVEVDPVKRPPRLRELNPTGRVPVLELPGGIAIRESTPICEWLHETSGAGAGSPLWPSDPDVRGLARGLLKWVDDELTANFFLSIRKAAFGLSRDDPPGLIDTLQGRLVRRWTVLDELLARRDGPWLAGGADPTLADLAAIPLAVRVPAWKPEMMPGDELTRARAWLAALAEHPLAGQVDAAGRPADG